jgi:hypothetical protein
LPESGEASVQHYYNIGKFFAGNMAGLIDPWQPTLGLSSTSIRVSENTFSCSFTRQNSNVFAAGTYQNYFNSDTNSPYLIAAYGPLFYESE